MAPTATASFWRSRPRGRIIGNAISPATSWFMSSTAPRPSKWYAMTGLRSPSCCAPGRSPSSRRVHGIVFILPRASTQLPDALPRRDDRARCRRPSGGRAQSDVNDRIRREIMFLYFDAGGMALPRGQRFRHTDWQDGEGRAWRAAARCTARQKHRTTDAARNRGRRHALGGCRARPLYSSLSSMASARSQYSCSRPSGRPSASQRWYARSRMRCARSGVFCCGSSDMGSAP